MARKSPRRNGPKKARKMEDLPAGHKARDVKGGSRENPTETITFAFQKVKTK